MQYLKCYCRIRSEKLRVFALLKNHVEIRKYHLHRRHESNKKVLNITNTADYFSTDRRYLHNNHRPQPSSTKQKSHSLQRNFKPSTFTQHGEVSTPSQLSCQFGAKTYHQSHQSHTFTKPNKMFSNSSDSLYRLNNRTSNDYLLNEYHSYKKNIN